jgi:Cation transport ATPase
LGYPLGFGLVTPTAIAVGIRRLLKRGIIVRNGEALQRLTEVRTFVIIEKTGPGFESRPRHFGDISLPRILYKVRLFSLGTSRDFVSLTNPKSVLRKSSRSLNLNELFKIKPISFRLGWSEAFVLL